MTFNHALTAVALVVTVASGCASEGTRAPEPGEIERSREVWDELEAQMGDTYWYEDENCLLNAPTHTVAVMQIEEGIASLATMRSIATGECVGRANRYSDAVPTTLPALYDACEALVQREGQAAVAVTFDTAGVIKSCTWEGSPACSDNCGEGFVLRDRGFGLYPAP